MWPPFFSGPSLYMAYTVCHDIPGCVLNPQVDVPMLSGGLDGNCLIDRLSMPGCVFKQQ